MIARKCGLHRGFCLGTFEVSCAPGFESLLGVLVVILFALIVQRIGGCRSRCSPADFPFASAKHSGSSDSFHVMFVRPGKCKKE